MDILLTTTAKTISVNGIPFSLGDIIMRPSKNASADFVIAPKIPNGFLDSFPIAGFYSDFVLNGVRATSIQNLNDWWNINAFKSVGGGTSNAGTSFLGSLYNKSTWSDLSDFTANGATATVNSGSILVSGGTSDLSKSLDISSIGYSSLEKYNITVQCTILEKTNASVGFGIGTRSKNTTRDLSTLCNFNMSSQAQYSGLTEIFSDNGSLIAGTSPLTFDLNDTIELSFERNIGVVTASVRNVTKNSGIISVSYTSKPDYPTHPQLNNTSYYSIYTFGGQFKVISINVFSKEMVGANLGCYGDSKTYGANCSDFANRWPTLLKNDYGTASVDAGCGDKTQDFINRLPEIIKLKPKQAIVYIGINDLGNSIPSATWQANIQTIYNTLTNAGIIVYMLDGIYDGTANTNTLKNYITANIPSANVIKTFDYGNVGGSLSSDNFHPNDLGEQRVYQGIIYSNKLKQ